MIDFQQPWILYFLIPLLGIAIFHSRRLLFTNKSFPKQEFLDDHLIEVKHNFNLFSIFSEIFPYLRFVSLGFLIVAASGPGVKRSFLPSEKMGVDIMIALDISGSMIHSKDFLPRNRLQVSIQLLQEFITKRKTDRLGLVVFAGAAYLQSPLTNDMNALNEILESIDTETIDEQGTAVGDAILLSTYRLKSSKTKSKVIVLLTDGVSNTGKIDPETSAETSIAYGIKIYTIGIGKENEEYEVNFTSLQDIAERTKGKFYRAENPSELSNVLNEIDSLEKDILADRPKELIQTDYLIYLNLAILTMLLDLIGRGWIYKYYA
jgi:Ca-activated chloride channel family protein